MSSDIVLADLRGGFPIIFFKELAEVICVVIAHGGSHLLDGHLPLLYQQFPGPFQADTDQMPYGGIPRLALENLGDIKRA